MDGLKAVWALCSAASSSGKTWRERHTCGYVVTYPIVTKKISLKDISSHIPVNKSHVYCEVYLYLFLEYPLMA